MLSQDILGQVRRASWGSAGRFPGPLTPAYEARELMGRLAEPPEAWKRGGSNSYKGQRSLGPGTSKCKCGIYPPAMPAGQPAACRLACLCANQQPGAGRHSRSPGPFQELGSSRDLLCSEHFRKGPACAKVGWDLALEVPVVHSSFLSHPQLSWLHDEGPQGPGDWTNCVCVSLGHLLPAFAM